MFDWLFKRDHCPEEEEGGGVDRLVLDTHAQWYWEGEEGTLAPGSPGRKKAASAAEETLEERCTRLEKEVGILKRMAASATPLSATGRSTGS